MNYSDALELLEKGNPETCSDFFKSNNYPLEYAYTLFLMGDIKQAGLILQSLDSVRADWLKKIIAIIQSKSEYPTYFQIRNFLEIDLTMFIYSKRIDYVNTMLRFAEVFQSINNETYKFLGRCLLKNGFPNESKIFLTKSLNEYFNDVELHYLFVEYYLYINDLKQAKKYAENCLRLNPEYYPAKKTYNMLNSNQ